MAKGYEQTLCGVLGAAYKITRQPALRRSLVLRKLCEDLQLGALVDSFDVSAGGSAKGVWVGMRIPSVEKLEEGFIADFQRQGGWRDLRVPSRLTIWTRLSSGGSKDRAVPIEQVVQEIDRLGAQAKPDAVAFREQLFKRLANATLPDWIEEPGGADLVNTALAVRRLEGRCSEAVANALIKRTPYAPAYTEAVHRFRRWLEAN